MHIADRYVGLPFAARGRDAKGVDCWGIVRLFLAEQAGLVLPRYDACDSLAETIAHEKRVFETVSTGQEQRFDVVICNEPVKQGLHWTKAQIHMGVVVDRGLVLHITRGMTSRIDAVSEMDVAEIRRVVI
jgi:cell wall-associated NlpC family hydrolase